MPEAGLLRFEVAPPLATGSYQAVRPRRAAAPKGWDALLICVAVFIAMAVGRVHELFPMLAPLKPTLVASLLGIALFTIHQSGSRRIGLLRSPTTLWQLAFLGWCGLSVIGALNQGVAFQAWVDLLATITMSVVLAGSVRRLRDVERLTLVYFGVVTLYVGVVLVRIRLTGDNWRLSNLYYYDANDLAALIVSAIPLGFYFALDRRRVWLRVLSAIGLAILATGLIRSGSRGGFLAATAMGLYVLFGFTTVPARARVAGLLVIAAVIVTTASEQYWTAMKTMLAPEQDYNATSEGGRLKIWRRGLEYIGSRPALGVGAANFPVAEGTISPLARNATRGIGVRWGAAHNAFIQVAAETGIPGFIFFVAWIASAFRSLRRSGRRPPIPRPPEDDPARMAQALMASLVGFVVASVFLSLAYTDMLYVLVGFTVALAKTVRLTDARARPRVGRIR